MASCLDPRFKMEFISADNKPRVKAKVASEMMECRRRWQAAALRWSTKLLKHPRQKKPRCPWEVSLN